MITQHKVSEQCCIWHDDGKTNFVINNHGKALDRRAAKIWFAFTCTRIISAIMHNTKLHELVKELFGEDT